MNGFIQIGVTAARDPMTGDFLPAVPLYIEATDAAQKSADGLIEDIQSLLYVYDTESEVFPYGHAHYP